MIRLGLLGSSGRMGSLIQKLIHTEFKSELELIASVRQGDAIEPLLSADVVIDVSLPPVMVQVASLAIKKSKSLPKFVIGSTGWTQDQYETIQTLSGLTPVLISSNFSVGVFALSWILRDYSPLFKKLGYTPVITEKHHNHKKDAPSGTARSLRESINPHSPEQIQTHSIRAGEIIGDHEVTFFSSEDQITLSHHAQSRAIFARGAIEVAKWLAQSTTQSNKILGMEDYFSSLKSHSLGVPLHGNTL
jgi:4-hydroxy-tetrahydrodipicolinate reductase